MLSLGIPWSRIGLGSCRETSCDREPTVSTSPPSIDYAEGTLPVGYHRFHPDRSMNFQCNRWLQWIGPSALDEIRAAATQVATYADWTRVFLELAAHARADDRTLAAAYHDRAAEFFMSPEDPRRGPARARFLRDMRALYGVGTEQPEAVPYRGFTLPAYHLVPEGASRGAIVVFGGFDSYVEEFFPMLAAIVRAGYQVMAFDGPGQGGALEDAKLAMTPAWEEPVGAVLDHFGLDDVTLVGISLGGGLAIRAAAFESRVRRVVSDDVLDDFLECIGRQIGPAATPPLRLLLAARARRVVDLIATTAAARKPVSEWGLRQGMHVTGTRSPYEFLRVVLSLTTRSVSDRVTADVLLFAGAEDHYVPSHQLHRQARALTRARSVTTRLFTAGEQAQNHCHVGNIGASVRAILSWLDSLDGVPAREQSSAPGPISSRTGQCA